MKIILLLFVVIVGCCATRLLSEDGLYSLFVKLLNNEYNTSDLKSVQDLIELLYLPTDEGAEYLQKSDSRLSITCIACRSAFRALTDLVESGNTDEEIINGVYVICEGLSIVSPRVCHGTLLLNVPILTYIIKTTPEAVPSTFCGVFFQNVDKASTCTFEDNRFEWEVELPPPSDIPIINSASEPLTIALISDAHIDPLYEPNGVAVCSDPTCCRKGQTATNTLKNNPEIEEKIVVSSLKELNGEKVIDLDVGEALRLIRNTSSKNADSQPPAGYWDIIRKKFDDVPVIPVIGNHESQPTNQWLVYDPLDAKTHLDWLVSELHKAEQAGEKVHILTHISPGTHDLIYTWTREYNRIVNRFASTIAAEFNGHTHSDEFKIFYSGQDRETPEPTNIINYIYNLTEANLTPNRRPHWFELYDVKNTFGIQDLRPATMSNLVYSMVTDQRPLLDLYSAFFSKLSDTRWPYCNDYCKIDNLCKVVVTVLWERESIHIFILFSDRTFYKRTKVIIISTYIATNDLIYQQKQKKYTCTSKNLIRFPTSAQRASIIQFLTKCPSPLWILFFPPVMVAFLHADKPIIELFVLDYPDE
ncbi:unnamed protein product, partial [Leptidea sinapis]